jgi:hypothetical protein
MIEERVFQLILRFIETLPSAMLFWWVTYYFMIKRKKVIIEKNKIIIHNIVILVLLTFLFNPYSLKNGSFGLVAIFLSIFSCFILKKNSNN